MKYVFSVEDAFDNDTQQSSSKLLFSPRFLFATFFLLLRTKYVFSFTPFGIVETVKVSFFHNSKSNSTSKKCPGNEDPLKDILSDHSQWPGVQIHFTIRGGFFHLFF